MTGISIGYDSPALRALSIELRVAGSRGSVMSAIQELPLARAVPAWLRPFVPGRYAAQPAHALLLQLGFIGLAARPLEGTTFGRVIAFQRGHGLVTRLDYIRDERRLTAKVVLSLHLVRDERQGTTLRLSLGLFGSDRITRTVLSAAWLAVRPVARTMMRAYLDGIRVAVTERQTSKTRHNELAAAREPPAGS